MGAHLSQRVCFTAKAAIGNSGLTFNDGQNKALEETVRRSPQALDSEETNTMGLSLEGHNSVRGLFGQYLFHTLLTVH